MSLDLEELRDLVICQECCCVYMPEYKTNYSGRYRANWHDTCKRCQEAPKEGQADKELSAAKEKLNG